MRGVVLFACGALADDVEHFPLREPDVRQYFKEYLMDVELPAKPPQLTNTTWEEFEKFGRHGNIVVVTDFAKGWPYLKWKCADFASEFPQGNMKAEYTAEQDRVNVGNERWMKPRPLSEKSDTKPQNAPYIWHVKVIRQRVKSRMIKSRLLNL